MRLRNILHCVGLCAMAIVLGATPQDQRPQPAAPRVTPAPPAPVLRLQPRIGAAPKPVFQVNNHSFTVNAKDPGVAAVRAIAPNSFDPDNRAKSVKSFYHDKFAADKAWGGGKIPADLYVGPFRREFIWWAWHSWALKDRAWWAWNNYAYFDHELWLQWMADQEFAQLIAQFDALNQPRILGFIPADYAANAPEVVYNDEYIEAVYNPDPTPPSIVVDSSPGGRLTNLIEGAPRLFGHKSLSISKLSDRVERYQFVSLPADFDPTYQIEVKRDGDLYVFGPRKTPAAEAFGDDAPNWQLVSNLVIGPGIEVTYQRRVKAGDKIRLHGVEWSIASEQIELFSPASSEAVAAQGHIVRDLERMLAEKGDFIQANPALVDAVRDAQDPAAKMITANGNIDDDAVTACRYELAALVKASEADADKSSDPHLAEAGREFADRVKSLEASVDDVHEALPTPGTIEGAPSKEAAPAPTAAQNGKSYKPRTIDLLALVDPKRDAASGKWQLDNGTLRVLPGDGSEIFFPYNPPSEFDYCVELRRVDSKFGNLIMFPHADKIIWWAISGSSCHLNPLPEGTANTLLRVESGQMYKLRIEVRCDRVRLFADEKLQLDYPTNYGEFQDRPDLVAPRTHLALQDWWSTVEYRKVQVIERSGPGTYFTPDGNKTQDIPSRAIEGQTDSPAAPPDSAEGSPTAVPSQGKVGFSGWHYIVNKRTGHFLFVISDNKNRGNWISLQPASHSDNEKWSLNHLTGSDCVKLVNKYSNKTVSVRAGSDKPGTDLIEWFDWKAGETYDKKADDTWKIEKFGENFIIVNEVSGQCLSEQSGPDRKAVQEPWKGSDDQLWRIERAD